MISLRIHIFQRIFSKASPSVGSSFRSLKEVKAGIYSVWLKIRKQHNSPLVQRAYCLRTVNRLLFVQRTDEAKVPVHAQNAFAKALSLQEVKSCICQLKYPHFQATITVSLTICRLIDTKGQVSRW